MELKCVTISLYVISLLCTLVYSIEGNPTLSNSRLGDIECDKRINMYVLIPQSIVYVIPDISDQLTACIGALKLGDDLVRVQLRYYHTNATRSVRSDEIYSFGAVDSNALIRFVESQNTRVPLDVDPDVLSETIVVLDEIKTLKVERDVTNILLLLLNPYTDLKDTRDMIGEIRRLVSSLDSTNLAVIDWGKSDNAELSRLLDCSYDIACKNLFDYSRSQKSSNMIFDAVRELCVSEPTDKNCGLWLPWSECSAKCPRIKQRRREFLPSSHLKSGRSCQQQGFDIEQYEMCESQCPIECPDFAPEKPCLTDCSTEYVTRERLTFGLDILIAACEKKGQSLYREEQCGKRDCGSGENTPVYQIEDIKASALSNIGLNMSKGVGNFTEISSRSLLKSEDREDKEKEKKESSESVGSKANNGIFLCAPHSNPCCWPWWIFFIIGLGSFVILDIIVVIFWLCCKSKKKSRITKSVSSIGGSFADTRSLL